MQKNSKVPAKLKAGLLAVATALGGTAAYNYKILEEQAVLKNEYIQAVAADTEVSQAVKFALVMGSYYESSYRHIGKPYIDKLGKGQPLTVCNGLTGEGVVAGKYYTPTECYNLEKARYIKYEKELQALPNWDKLTDLQKASVLDFVHNKGEAAFANSTMKRKIIAGNFVGACKENNKWVFGTVNGVKQALPGLVVRGEANAELCEAGL